MNKNGGCLDVELYKEKNKCILQIKDQGHGIEKQNLEKIFDPFFSTKNEKHGTGMGLAVVNSIVEQYQGKIIVESNLHKGSIFKVHLPLSNKAVTGKSLEDVCVGNEIFNEQKIMIIDDEIKIGQGIKQILEHRGAKVTVLDDAEEFVQSHLENLGLYDFIITDLNMPKLNGIGIAKIIRDYDGKIPVILMTGHQEQVNTGILQKYNLALLPKPFKLTKLINTIEMFS
ncbi:MAG: hybrid sensor histidine kinase/response regulator [bacterium]